MRALRIICVLLAAFIVFEAVQGQPPAGDADLSGYYAVKGSDVNGASYTGVVALIKIKDNYVASWSVGPAVVQGIGMRNGGWLSIGWIIKKDGGAVDRIGVTVYKIDDAKKSLRGKWASLPGTGMQHEEELSWLKAMDRPPMDDDMIDDIDDHLLRKEGKS